MYNLGIWVPRALRVKNKKDYIFITISLLIRQRNYLSKISLQMRKSGTFMTEFNAKGCELTRMNTQHRPKRWNFMEDDMQCVQVEWPWYYSSWVFKLQSDTQCSLTLSTAAMCSWKSKKTFCIHQSGKNCPSPRISKAIFRKYHLGKNYLDWSLPPQPPYSQDLAPNDFCVFCFQQNALNNKFFFSRSSEKVCGKHFE